MFSITFGSSSCSIDFDHALAVDDIAGSIAHVHGLGRAGLLAPDAGRVKLNAELAREIKGILRDNVRYLGYTLVPLAVMVLPAVLLITQLDLHYGRRPLRVGERTILAVKVLPRAASLDEVSLRVPPGIGVDTPALRLPSAHEVDWRLIARQPGVHEVQVRAGGQEFTKRVIVAKGGPLAEERAAPSLRTQFLHPGEPPLPAGAALASVRVTYPPATLPLGRWRLHWFWPWLVISRCSRLSATSRLRNTCSARYTTPIPPSEMRQMIR